MIPNHRLAELAGGHLWKSPDPAPSQDQYEQVAQGFVQSRVGNKVPAENTCPSAKKGRLSLGPYPRAKGCACKRRTEIPLGQLSHGDAHVRPCLAAPLHRDQGRQRPQGAKACLCCSSRCPAPRAADLPSGPCMAAANRTLHPLGVNNPW